MELVFWYHDPVGFVSEQLFASVATHYIAPEIKPEP